MDFLRSEFEFKEAARRMEHYLSTLSLTDVVRSADLVQILLPMARISGGDELLSGSQKLAEALNGSNRSALKHSQILQKLAFAFTRRPYQSFQPSLDVPTDFRRLFPDAALPSGSLEPGRTQLHPYPKELYKLPELADWRANWEEHAVSTRERPFFPPMLPKSYFIGFTPRYELRRDWSPASKSRRQHTSYHFENGWSCVLVRHERKQLIGAASWRWWGNFGCINGVGYSLFVRTESGWLKIFFDIRPSYSGPTYGPNIYREGCGDDDDHIQASLEELIHLPIHRYVEEDEED